jgi:hypothetical protein
MQYSQTVGVVRIGQDGGVQHFPVSSVSWSGEATLGGGWSFDKGASQLPEAFFSKIAPDGIGGQLFVWGARSSIPNDPQHLNLSRLLNGSAPYTVPLPANGDIATNQQGTAFFADRFARNVSAVDVTSGAPKWNMSAFAFLGATDDGGAIVVSAPGTQELDQNGNVTASALSVYPDAYLDPGIYDYLSRDFGELVVLKTPLKMKISNGFAIPQKGHTANQIGPLSPATFAPVADCTGFDGDDSYGLLHGALMVPAGGSNKLLLRDTSQSVFLVAKDPTLISEISPNFLTTADKNVTITVTAAPGKTGGTWITFQGLDLNQPIGKAFYVVIYPKIFKSAAYFKVVAPASGQFPQLAPDDAWMPTQLALETFMNQIYEKQANVHFSISGPITLMSAYDFSPQDGAMRSPGLSFGSTGLEEANKIQSDSVPFSGYDRKVFVVRKIKDTRAIGGFAYTPEQIASTPTLPSGAFIDQFAVFGACSFCQQDEAQNPFPQLTIAHELGHTFGLYPSRTDHYPDPNNPFHLMSEAPERTAQTLGSGACELNFFEWEVLHGKPSDPKH